MKPITPNEIKPAQAEAKLNHAKAIPELIVGGKNAVQGLCI